MINEIQIAAFNAAYAKTIDSDAMEQWPTFFTKDCHYRVTNVDNHAEGLAAGIVWADSQDMLTDRISALREANIYERHVYRHFLGDIMAVPLGHTTIRGGAGRMPLVDGRLMLPFRDGAHVCSDMAHLKLPGFATYGDHVDDLTAFAGNPHERRP